jgi:hypothetical protein
MSLIELIDNSRTDKNTTHSYLEKYEALFYNKKVTALNVLEIGVQDGGSIKLWHDYFPNATVYGLDIRKIRDMWNDLKNKPRIKLGCFDAYDQTFFDNQITTLNTKFDILIDDGPHTLESMFFFIDNYCKVLSHDGILVIEDVQSIDWINELKMRVPKDLQEFIEIYDLRINKKRYDDIMFVINKNKPKRQLL